MEKTKNDIRELAAKAGVSIATISRVLNPETRHKVAPQTLKKIDALVKKCHYTPNLAAQNLRKTAYQAIGVVFPHHTGILLSEYYSQIISGVADALLDTEFRLKMILMKPEKPRWDHYNIKDGEGVDGVILTYWRTIFSGGQVFNRFTIPSVIINNVEEDIKARFVAGDHFSGGRMAAKYLYDHGHRRIATLYGIPYSPDIRERFRGFKTYLEEKGITVDDDSIFKVDFDEQRAYEITDDLLARKPEFTAVFCMNDIQALGILRRLRERGVDCPGRLSVMGYDDDMRTEHSSPPLTTVQAPVYDLAKKAATDLIEQIRHKKDAGFCKPCYSPVSIVERGSVREV
ncbi:MAG: LacI family DNA-binding transcriptional regulator [Candidatus Omnitrophota bacterium]|nr:LacI family DNA-binding transcriptional regulator [Candidatus Omnitrophota bacterium]